MKNVQNLAMLSAVIAFASCNSAKTDVKHEVQTETATSEALVTTEIPQETKTVEGTVLENQNGKDGYTAKIETVNKEIYYVTVSYSNLKDHTQFKTVKLGDKLKVSGEFWQMEGNNHITVREIR